MENVSGINNQVAVNTNVKKAEVKEEAKKFDASGYAEKAAAPSNADLYKSMYGVKEQKSYSEQMAEVRAKYEMDVDDKNREIERNRNMTPEQEAKEAQREKSYEEQYLEFKHKYE